MSTGESTNPVFGFQAPSAEDFGKLAEALIAAAEKEVGQKKRRARLMLLPSMAFFLLFAFGLGSVLWALGIDLRPGSLAVMNVFAFLLMAGLGYHYEQDVDVSAVADGEGFLHRRLLSQALIVKLLTGAFFTLPAVVMKNLGRLFPRTPRVDPGVLSLATNLAAALDEEFPVERLQAFLPENMNAAIVDEAVLLLRWAGVGLIRRRRGKLLLGPGSGRDALLAGILNSQPLIVRLSALPSHC